jgi:ribonuclease HI
MELQAIWEAIDFLPKDFKGYVTIETDSEGCMKTMMGSGRRWQIDNYVNLKGNKVKNRGFIDKIVNSLKTLHAEYKKVEGHKGDQWNDRADELARMGLDEAASWPQCSFEITMPNASKIPFRVRSIPPTTTTAQLAEMPKSETDVKLPLPTEIRTYDSDCRSLTGDYSSGRFFLAHNSQPPPAAGAQPNPAQAPDPVAERPARFGVFNGVGVSFTSSRPIDCSKISMDRMISEFNKAVPGFRNEPRFFVATTEIDPTALIPGQPYSVYPRKIKRPTENRAQLGGAAQPPRIEGPLIEIQWKVSDISGNQLCLPGNSRVPEEISLLQLFKIFIAARNRISGIQIMWGNHYRDGNILEIGKVTTLEEGDLVGIIVDQGAAPQTTQIEVDYEICSEKFTILVDRSMTIEQLKQRMNFNHKGRGISAIASEGVPIADDDPVEDWTQRTAGIPLTAVLPKKVQVVVDFRGVEKHFTIQDNASDDAFKVLVRHFLGLGQKIHIAVMPLGIDRWEIRAGFNSHTGLQKQDKWIFISVIQPIADPISRSPETQLWKAHVRH